MSVGWEISLPFRSDLAATVGSCRSVVGPDPLFPVGFPSVNPEADEVKAMAKVKVRVKVKVKLWRGPTGAG